jgi:fibronectin-binding autotransporter adhesin
MSHGHKVAALSLTVALALAGVMGLLWLLGGLPTLVAAAPVCRSLRAPGDVITVCLSGCDYTTIQGAVDAATEGETIKVATGVYTDLQGRAAPAGYDGPSVITQVVYISKTVTIRGGYTTTNWTTPYPITQPTTLDAQGQGRGLLVAGDPSTNSGQAISPTVEGLRITGGDATGLGGSKWGQDGGGGVYVITATVTISNNQVFSNTTPDQGGGLFLKYSDATLSGNTVISNTANRGGGGLYLENSAATLSGNTVMSNTAGGGGGGLLLADSDAVFISNTVISNTVNFGGGGGLYLYESAATLSGNTVIFNIADYGGGLYLEGGTSALTSNSIISNTAYGTAPWGGGGGLLLIDSDAMFNGNIIVSNTAYGTAPWTGGGGLLLVDSDAMFNGNIIVSNIANYYGGGLCLDYSDIVLTNTVVADNRAGAVGSGLYIYSSSPRLLHTTIARNSGGDGSGVYVTDSGFGHYSTVVLTNTILVSHSVGISVTGGNTVTVNSILWHGTPVTISQATTATVTVQNQHQSGPLFAADGYHLMSGSAAVDKGVDAGVDTDIDGDLRPQGSAPDLGADEFVSAPGKLYLPIIMKNASP